MRMFRSIAAAAALVMVASMAALVSAPAQAAAPAKPPHKMGSVKAGGPVGGPFFIKGKISTFKGKKVIVKRSVNGMNGKYRSFKKPRTNGKGQFRVTFQAKIGHCFKVFVPGTPRNAASQKFVGCIVRV